MKIITLIIVLGLFGCTQAQPPTPAPTGSHEVGFDNYCASHPGTGTCR